MASTLTHRWIRSYSWLLLCLAAGLGLGLALQRPWPALAITALALLGWHGWKLQRLMQRVERRQHASAAHPTGVWSALECLLRRDQDARLAHKHHLLAMLRAYRAVADALPDGVVVVERNSQRMQWCNHAATTLLGLSYPRQRNITLASALPSLPIARWLAGGRNAEPLVGVISPANPALQLRLRLVPYSEDLWLVLARDITKLTHLEQMRRDFVANVSHELRTPLTVIHGYLEMLDAHDNPDWAPLLQEMRQQSQRMTHLVEDLLTLSRLEARDALPLEPVAMASMLACLQREAEALSQGRHHITIEDTVNVDLLGADKELHSAFSNLVSNAVRYTPSGGHITIRFQSAPHGGACLRVEDSGPGIPADAIPRLTERFYRVSASRSRDSGGTGLGLAIVKHVLGLHGATLSIASTPGTGSQFSCQFPAAGLLPRQPPPSAAMATP